MYYQYLLLVGLHSSTHLPYQVQGGGEDRYYRQIDTQLDHYSRLITRGKQGEQLVYFVCQNTLSLTSYLPVDPLRRQHFTYYYKRSRTNSANCNHYHFILLSVNQSIMASSLMFINMRGEEVMARHYRGGISKSATDNFRHKVLIII